MAQSVSFVSRVFPMSKHKPSERKLLEIPKGIVDYVPIGAYQVTLVALGTVRG